MILGERRTATVVAAQRTQLLGLPKGAFTQLFLRAPRSLEDFSRVIIVRDAIASTWVQLSQADGLGALQTYYWRVIPADEFGLSPDAENAEVRSFPIDDTNPGLPGNIAGVVKDGGSGAAISGATRFTNAP